MRNKNIIIVFFCLLAFMVSVSINSCSSVSAPTSHKNESKKVTYVYNEKEYPVVFHCNGDELIPEECTDYEYVQQILENPESGFWLDPKDSTKLHIYASNEESEAVYERIVKKHNLKKTTSTQSNMAGVYLFENIHFLGRIRFLYNMPDLQTEGFTDMTSSIQLSSDYEGLPVRFFEHPNYGGHSFGMITMYTSGNSWVDQRWDLRDWHMTTSRNWNDRISSVRQGL